MVRSPLKVAMLAALVAAPAAAQSTGTPVFQAPYRAFTKFELGASLSDPGQGWALEGFYRWGYKNFDIGIRSGIWDDSNTSSRFLIGGDARTRAGPSGGSCRLPRGRWHVSRSSPRTSGGAGA